MNQNTNAMEFKNISQAKKQIGISYLGCINASAKMIKNQKVSGQYTYLIYLSPANTSGFNVCSHSTVECRKGCLSTSGHAGMEIQAGKTIINNARLKKTRLLFNDQNYFMNWLIAEMKHYQNKAKNDGFGFSVRLNGTSDIDWSKVLYYGYNIFELFPDVQFYDYTKNPLKFKNLAANYTLTFSYTGRNWSICKELLQQGFNVAVVFDTKKNKPLPLMFNGYNVLDGDLTDYRPDDCKGVIIGLRFKNIADKQAQKQVLNSCFVVKENELQ